MTTPTRSSLSAEEHAARVMIDATLPTTVRARAAEWYRSSGGQLPEPILHAILKAAAVEPDDHLWAALVEVLALDYPDATAVWDLCRERLQRFARVPPRRLANILSPLLTGGVPASEIAELLSTALGEDLARAVLVWLLSSRPLPDEIGGPLRARVAQGVMELHRSTLMLHVLALCDATTRTALGRSGAYTRYRSLYWAVQDWPYVRREDLAREVQRGIILEEEAEVLWDLTLALRSPSFDQNSAEMGAGHDAFYAELDRVGRSVIDRLHLEDTPPRLFVPEQQHEGDA